MARDAGNRLNQARSIAIAARSKRLNEAIGSGDPADFFRFRLSQRSSSRFSLTQLRANADLELLDRRGRVLRPSRRPGNRPEQISINLNAGTYFLRVRPRTGQDSTRYRLEYRATALSSPTPNPTNPNPNPGSNPNPNPAPRNTNPAIAAAGLSIPRGTSATLNSNLLSASDDEQPVSNLVYTLTSLPQSGSLFFNNERITALDRTFTQADIAAERLRYDSRALTLPLGMATASNSNPAISGSNAVWEGRSGEDIDIFYSNGNTTRPITNNAVDDVNPQISDSNLVWQEGRGSDARILLLQNINSSTLGTPVSLAPGNTQNNRNPVISGVNVAWQGSGGGDGGDDSEIFLWNGTSARQLTSNNAEETNVQISGSNLVWQGSGGSDGGADSEIFWWNGTSVQQLTSNSTEDVLPQISGSNIVWQGAIADGTFEIFFSNGGANSPVRLTNNTIDDVNPRISGSNLVWQSQSSSTISSISFATVGGGTTPTPIALTAAGGFAVTPQISGSSIVWRGETTPGSSLELFFSDRRDAPPIQLTSNSGLDNGIPRISGGNVVWSRIDSANPTNSQVFLASAARQDSFGFTVSDRAGGSTAGTFNFTIVG